MAIIVFLIIIGFAFLIVGANLLINGASNIAKRFHISEIIIGLTVVSIGTSLPELFISITSAFSNYSDVVLGNVIGSNISNLLLILGVSAIITNIDFKRETIFIETPIALLVTIFIMIMSNTGKIISRIEGIILLLFFLCFISYTVVIGIKEAKLNGKKDNFNKKEKNIKVLKDILFIVLGIIGLKIGGNLAVNNSLNLANYFKISEKVISLTILSLGTSLPELVTGIVAITKGNKDIAVGNIIGSNIFNMLLIVGISSIIKPINFNLTYNFDYAILILATAILALFPILKPKEKMSKGNGILYFTMYLSYIGILFIL